MTTPRLAEPIPVRVTRYACPFCPRSNAKASSAREHIARCWYNPANRGCKTCAFYVPAWNDTCDAPGGCVGCGGGRESCAAGVNLDGRDACTGCNGAGLVDTMDNGAWGDTVTCTVCKGVDSAPVRPGPITGCPLWAPEADAPVVQS